MRRLLACLLLGAGRALTAAGYCIDRSAAQARDAWVAWARHWGDEARYPDTSGVVLPNGSPPE